MKIDLEDTLQKTGRTLCDKFGIHVICEGLQCCTDGNTIYLPALPDVVSSEVWNAIRGYIDHESAHLIAKSDFTLAERFTRKHGQQAFAILNALEDVRVETVLCEKYPGSVQNLQHGYDYALKNADPDADMLWQIETILYAIGRNRNYSMLSPEAIAIAEQFHKEAIRAVRASDTRQIAVLALSVWRHLRKMLPPQPASNSTVNGSSGKTGDGTGNANGQSTVSTVSPTSDKARQGLASEPNSAKDASPAQQNPLGNSTHVRTDTSTHTCAGSACMSRNPHNAGAMSSLGQVLSRNINRDAKHKQQYRAYTTRYDEVIRNKSGNPDTAQQMLARTRKVCSAISQKLLLSLQAQRENRWLGDMESGSINPPALHRLHTGSNPRVFRKRIKAQSMNTAVTLLIDQSRSMLGTKIELAELTALAFTESLQRLNIPVSVEGFSTKNMCEDMVKLREDLSKKAPDMLTGLRMNPLVHTVYKDFSENLRPALPRFATGDVYSLTPLGEALMHAARGLAQRKENRRILFCLTDGKPMCGVGDETISFTHAKETIQRIELAGIEVILIGIREDCVKLLHEKHVIVNDIHDLPREVMRTLSNMLQTGKTIHV